MRTSAARPSESLRDAKQRQQLEGLLDVGIGVCCVREVVMWTAGAIGGYNSPWTDQRHGYEGALPTAALDSCRSTDAAVCTPKIAQGDLAVDARCVLAEAEAPCGCTSSLAEFRSKKNPPYHCCLELSHLATWIKSINTSAISRL